MLFLTLLLGVVVFLLLFLHWFQTRSHFAKLLNSFPGRRGPILVGEVALFSRKRDIVFKQVQARIRENNQTFRMWSGHHGILHIITPDDAEIILSSMKLIDKGLVYDFLQPWLGTGLLTSTGSKWQRRRKILTTSFHFNILRKFVEIFAEHCNTLKLELKEECKKPKTDIVPLMTKFTLSTICETAMGTKLDEQDETQRSYVKSVYNIGEFIVKRSISPWLYPNMLFKLSITGWIQKKCIKILHNFTESVIRERERNFKSEDMEDLENSNEDTFVRKKRFAMLDLLLSAKKLRNEIDHVGIREEVDTFMFEGHDTTAMAISYVLLTLANHKTVQEKIIMELDEIFGTSTRSPSYDDLQKMKYTELCIKECLRLYPSVPFILRVLSEDTVLTHHTAPAGVQAVVHIFHMHRNPEVFNDPERFDPERFLPENSQGRHPFAYIPFSAGPRNCIGQKFAMLELKSIVSCVLRNFTMSAIDSSSDLTWVLDLVLRTSGAINIKFETRDMLHS